MEVIKLDDFPINPIQDQIYEIIPDKTKIVASTNRLFNKYPTRYISAVPRFAINAYSKAGETVLDPFCGSGTTAIEAMLLGRNAMSIDIDPFARLLIKVKTTVYSKEDIDFLDEVVRKIKEMSPDESFQYPIPGIPNIEKWFCDKSILWLSFFKYTIDKLAADNQNVKDYLYVIQAEEELDEPEEIVYTQLSLDIDQNETLEQAYVQTGLPTSEENDILLQTAKAYLQVETINYIAQNGKVPFVLAHPEKKKIVQTVTQKLEENQDWGKIFKNNENPFLTWLEEEAEQTYTTIIGKFIPIPRIRVTDAGVEEYIFVDFDLDLSVFTHMPIKNELLIQNLEDMSDRERIKGDAIDFEGYHPEKVILTELHKKPEIDYERCSKLLFKLITQVCDHYETGYGINGMQNIVMMYRREIAGKIYDQMMKHFYCENGLFQEEVIDVEYSNLPQKLNCRQKVGLYDDFKENYEGHIKSVLFTGIKKGVYPEAKFDSDESELTLARLLDRDDDVLKWLRPAPNEFNITYNRGKRYEPDFVVETADCCYLVEVKGENKLTDPDVLDKKKRGIQYCDVSTRWCKANGYKPWRYLFIPSKQVLPNSSFAQLAKRFQEQ